MFVSDSTKIPFFEEPLAKRSKLPEEESLTKRSRLAEEECSKVEEQQISFRIVASDVEILFGDFCHFAGNQVAQQFHDELQQVNDSETFLSGCISKVAYQVMSETDVFDEENLARLSHFAFSYFDLGQERKDLEFLFRFSKIENLSSCEVEAAGEGINGAKFVKHGQERLFVQKEYESSATSPFYGIEPFEAAQREAAAHKLAGLLSFEQVPFTVCIKCSESKLITLQTFVHSRGSLQSLSFSEESSQLLDGIPEDEVHKLAVFDTIFSNADRHIGNILVTEQVHLVAIDNEALLSSDPVRDRPKVDYLGLRQMNASVGNELKDAVLSLRPESVKEQLKNLNESACDLFEKKLIFVQTALAQCSLTVKEMVVYARDEHEHFCSIDLTDAKTLAENLSDFKQRFIGTPSRPRQIRLIKIEGLKLQPSLGDSAEISQSMFFGLMHS